MSHFILPTLNAFMYCVIFMVVTVSCGIIYAIFKYFCSDEEQTNTPQTNGDYYEEERNGFTSNPTTYPTDRVDPEPEHIPMMPVYKPPSPSLSPAPYPPYPATTTPYPTTSSPRHSPVPYPTTSSPRHSPVPYPTGNTPGMPVPYPTGNTSGMPVPYTSGNTSGMPMPYPQHPTGRPDDSPPSYQDAMVQPPYNPHYRPT